MATKIYRVLKAFVHQHLHCDAGATIKLTAEQAEFLRHGGFVAPVAEAPPETPAGEPDASVTPTADVQPDDGERKRRKGGRE
jgi:hypothetical protein